MRPDWHVIGYHRGPVMHPITTSQYTGRLIECPGDRFDAWRRWRLPAAAKADNIDLLHCPANLTPPWLPSPTMVTIHDLLPLNGTKKLARTMAASIRRCVNHGTVIITPSHYTADQLVGHFNAAPQRIVVNHRAADQAMVHIHDDSQLSEVAGRYELDARPILHLGAPDPRKNTINAIQAFAALPADIRAETPLLVIGLDQQAHRREMAELCERLHVRDTVKLHGFADEADMPALFSMARVLLYPSRSEGFGLPILDAWMTRTAVLTSETTSLPEVGGNAAIYVDPEKPTEITEQLHRLLTDSAHRSAMVRAGVERVTQFSWERTAERFIVAVESAVNQKRGQCLDAA